MDLKWPEMPLKANFGHPIWPINLKWPEMRSKVIFRHPKWPPEMARNVIQSEFRTLKMADGSHFVKIKKKKSCIDLKWPEMRPKVIFGHPKWPPAAIL